MQLEEASVRVVVTALCLDHFPRSGDAALDYLQGLWPLVNKAEVGTLLSINTFLPRWNSINSQDHLVDKLNSDIRSYATADSNVLLTDFATIAADLGHEEALDPRFWYLYKAPFRERFLFAWASRLVDGVAHHLGRSKKLLLLDCDNTLWGGILGEAGPEGIELDAETYPGKPWHDFQRQILELHSRGVLLGLCSKNNEADVLEILESHPAMLIRREHLACWRINWESKASNIAKIAHELNLGLDNIAFIDDSPHECELVRQLTPEVTVLQTPSPSHLITSLLRNYGGFPDAAATEVDLLRTRMYREESQRNRTQEQFADFDAYLSSLELHVEIRPPLPNEIARVAQLTQRTNQFNLTTNRYIESSIAALTASPDALVIVLSVKDRFGDYGLTGAAILKSVSEGSADLSDFLLSCRVLGRRVELAFIARVTELAFQRWDLKKLTAVFNPSVKNQQTREFYETAGFEFLREDDSGARYYCTGKAIDSGSFIGTVSKT